VKSCSLGYKGLKLVVTNKQKTEYDAKKNFFSLGADVELV
jgi:hypothetical protein